MIFANISGCHLNPAVTLGLVVGGRHPAKEAAGYIAAQVVGGILGAGILYVIATERQAPKSAVLLRTGTEKTAQADTAWWRHSLPKWCSPRSSC